MTAAKTTNKAKTPKAEKGSYVDKVQTDETRKAEAVKLSDIKQGDLMAFIYYAKVTDKEDGYLQRVSVNGVAGAPPAFHVQGKELIENSFSADQFHRTEKLSKTAVAEILTTSYNRPFTVCFDKADGNERTLRGRLVQPEPLLGRSHVEDLDITEGHNLRLVDHRTLKYLIVDGVKYVVK